MVNMAVGQSKWNQAVKPAVPWWLDFDPYPGVETNPPEVDDQNYFQGFRRQRGRGQPAACHLRHRLKATTLRLKLPGAGCLFCVMLTPE